MNGWYKTSDGTKHIIESRKIINLSQKDIVELVIPNNTEWISCRLNNLTELIIPDSVEWIDCENNKLTELGVPNECQIYCDKSVKLTSKLMYNRSKRLKNILNVE